ncbi:MAG: alpha/beta fold hydrolase [Candidatus Obscuribacterales bacterium]|nr:alpha/beta fold hydrolase [Candidatus Obscuribacterales bacterium]
MLNIAGLVFFILFLNLRGSYKAVRKDKVVLERNLAFYRSQNVVGEALSSERIVRKTFVSHKDGQMDYFAFEAPNFVPEKKDYILILYLHGMGSNYMEPFVAPHEQPIASALVQKDSAVGVLSCSYRKESSWGNDLALADITQNVREVMMEYPFSKIVVMGTSMGGTVALNYACVAPADIKEKIVGVVSVESAGDLTQLYKTTANNDIRQALIISLGGMPEQIPAVYADKSFLHNLNLLPQSNRIYILSAKSDRIVPTKLQNDIVNRLNQSGYKVKFEEIEGDHQSPAAKYYVSGLEYVLGSSQ